MSVALELILKEGHSALTTNRIAQEAKVNISSLYQYFPNRESIVLAIYERSAAEFAAMTHKTMMAEMSAPLEEAMPRMIKRAVTYIRDKQTVFLRLVNEVPELRQTAKQMSIENLAYPVTYAWVKRYYPDMDDATLRLKLFLVQNTCMALIYRYLTDKPEGISQTRFINEVSQMALDCLKRGESASR